MGQQFSTRVDVLAPEFVQELEKLQDNVPAFDSAAAVRIVETSLGTPVLAAFDECASHVLCSALPLMSDVRQHGEEHVCCATVQAGVPARSIRTILS